MKRTTRNNILRYLISVVFVSVLLLISSLLYVGFSWLDDKTGWPIYTVATVAGLIYMVWYVEQCITIKDEKEKDMQDALRTEYEKGRHDVIEKTLKWLWDLNQQHEIMSYTDSHVLDSEELQKYYKNNIEE